MQLAQVKASVTVNTGIEHGGDAGIQERTHRRR
jgi:hypothetical protein